MAHGSIMYFWRLATPPQRSTFIEQTSHEASVAAASWLEPCDLALPQSQMEFFGYAS